MCPDEKAILRVIEGEHLRVIQAVAVIKSNEGDILLIVRPRASLK